MQRFLTLCLLVVASSWQLRSETFKNPYRVPATSDPNNVIVADFNGDGKLDIVYSDVSALPRKLHVLLGQGGGSYIAAPTISLPANVNPPCRALDTNKDGKPDLVCAYSYTQNASLVTLLGNGDGTFGAPIYTSLPSSGGNYFYPFIFPPMEVNSDGVPDLMVLDSLNQQSYIMLGDGHGGFKLGSRIGASIAAIAQDINGDGKPDLLFVEGPYVMLGNGDGTFGPAKSYSEAFDYNNVCTYADMDKDGHVDAVCGYVETITGDIDGATHLIILHGNADGSFNTTPFYDKVFGNHDTEYDGEGTFDFPLQVADMNGDGIPDIIAGAGDGYSVLLGVPGAAGIDFSYPKHYAAGSLNIYGSAMQQIIDLNGDGQLDIVATGTNGVYISYGRRDGTFDTASAYEVSQVLGHATFADFNGDGVPDIAATGDTTIEISLGKGDGTFAPFSSLSNSSIKFNTPLTPLNAQITHGDFNGDGKQDLLAVGSSSIYQYDSYVYFGNGDGTFQPLKKVANTSVIYPLYLSQKIADLNSDGRDDILASDTNSLVLPAHPNIYVGLANGDGTFQTVITQMPTEAQQQGVFTAPNCTPDLADFNHDGKLDAVFGSVANAYVLKGHGDGSFDTSGTMLPIPSITGSTSIGTAAVATGDFDGDGNMDFALLYQLGNLTSPNNPYVFANGAAVFVYYGDGTGGFSAPVTAGVFAHHYRMINASDLNGDGLADIILRANDVPYDNPSLSILHSTPGRTFASEVNYTAGTGLGELAALDVNRDGFPDLLVANNLASSVTVLLNQHIPTVSGTLIAVPEPSVVGQPFTATALFSLPANSTATSISGPVAFSVDGTTVGSAAVTNNSASFSLPGTFSKGTHQLTAYWGGDTNFPAVQLSAPHAVTGLPATFTVTSSLNPANLGQAVTLTATLSTQSAGFTPPTGTISFTDNGVVLGSALPVMGSGSFGWTLLKGFATAGQHTIVATYSGDSNYNSATATLVETVNPLATASVLQSAPNPSVYGQAVTFTTAVTANLNDPAVNLFRAPATVTFTGLPGGPYTAAVATASTAASTTTGDATYVTSTLPAGTYTVSASYSGNVNTIGSSAASVVQVVQRAPTSTTLSATPVTAYQTQTVTFSAHVAGVGTPGGSVQFLDGNAVLATVQLAAGSATVSTTQMGVGTHTIMAVYSGDANDVGSTSQSAAVTIQPSDFALSLDPPTVSLVTGHHTTLHLTASSVGVFAGTVHLSVSTLPQWVTFTFKPADLQVPQGGNATTAIYLDTDAVIGYLSELRSSESRGGSGAVAIAFAVILVPVALRRRRGVSSLASLLGLVIAAALLAGAAGCSGKYPDSTPPGTYPLQITGTSGSLTHTVTLNLTVQ